MPTSCTCTCTKPTFLKELWHALGNRIINSDAGSYGLGSTGDFCRA